MTIQTDDFLPVASVPPSRSKPTKRQHFGLMAEKIGVPDDFDLLAAAEIRQVLFEVANT